ncbi:MAG: RibD family protein, partial [Gammaproteobacteria bacterium]|nr:RibD family protein [Gammaproteobacteria bacterium]
VIADSQLRTPATAKMLTLPGQTLVLTGCDDQVRTRRLAEAGAEIIRVATGNEGRIDLVAALKLLGDRGVNELMVEAGATLNGALYRQSLIDELVVYQAPVLLGTTARSLLDIGAINSMDQRAQLQLQSLRRVGNDWRLRLRPRNL